jgi:hypothetical protein
MTIAQKLEQQGIEKGRVEGRLEAGRKGVRRGSVKPR